MSTIARPDMACRDQERTPTMATNDQERDRERLIEVLQRELAAAHTREQTAQEQEVLRLRAFEQAHKQLEMARERLEQAQKQLEQVEQQSSPARLHGGPHAMRRRILELIEGEPQGLGRVEIEKALGVDKHLGDTLIGMARPSGPLIRTGKGLYAVAPGHAAV